MSIRGIEMNYYAICRRKLWLFNRGLGLEQGNDRVTEGAVLHEQAYDRLDKEWNITEDAVVDAVEDEWIREVKISSRMEYADRLQMLYYLYLLKERGYDEKMKSTFKHRKLNRMVSYRYLIRLESYKLIKHIIGDEKYKPFKAWW